MLVPSPAQASSYTSTQATTTVRLLSFSPQCLSIPDPSTTTTTDPSTGELPMACSAQAADTAGQMLYLLIVIGSLLAFGLFVLVGLKLWD